MRSEVTHVCGLRVLRPRTGINLLLSSCQSLADVVRGSDFGKRALIRIRNAQIIRNRDGKCVFLDVLQAECR